MGEEAGIQLGIEGDVGHAGAHGARARAPCWPTRGCGCASTSLRFATPRQVVPQHFDVQPAMGRHVEAAIRGATPVKEALREMDATVTRILRGG